MPLQRRWDILFLASGLARVVRNFIRESGGRRRDRAQATADDGAGGRQLDSRGHALIPVDQQEIHPDIGDCLKCCVASILELPYETVPHFVKGDRWYGVPWFHALWDFLRPMGLDAICFDGDSWGPNDPEFAIVSGQSPRYACTHAVVYQRGKGLVHDPHPSKAGILGKPLSYMGLFRDEEYERWRAALMKK